MKLWAGRFSGDTDRAVNDFNSSLPFDRRLYRQDIQGSLAHADMLFKQGIIAREDHSAIDAGLRGILLDLENGALDFDDSAEDIHTFVEAELTKRVGNPGKMLHTARSRNDQVALDLRLYLREEADILTEKINALIAVLCSMAREHAETVMPGYTHMQRAQPITLGHHLAAYAWMLLRDRGRISDAKRRMNECPLGCGALAGTTYPIDRQAVSDALGFEHPVQNSLDGVSDRDFCIELACACAILMTHLSRFSEEIILWCSSEFGFAELDDAFATGSSIMPQKKNPDVAELVRGKTGRVFGGLTALLTVMKGIPLAYNKDMQEDKEAVFDCIDTVKLCITTFTPMLKSMRFKKDSMRAAAGRGLLNATDCADYLVGKGLAFRDAYKITGELVAVCVESGKSLEELSLAELKAHAPQFDADVYDKLNLTACVCGRSCEGGPAPDAVLTQISLLEQSLS